MPEQEVQDRAAAQNPKRKGHQTFQETHSPMITLTTWHGQYGVSAQSVAFAALAHVTKESVPLSAGVQTGVLADA